jgi:hypothetical protein
VLHWVTGWLARVLVDECMGEKLDFIPEAYLLF